MVDSDSPNDLSNLSSAHNDSEAFGTGADHLPIQPQPDPGFDPANVVGITASDLEAFDEANRDDSSAAFDFDRDDAATHFGGHDIPHADADTLPGNFA
ncbi:hypothetical protein WEH80_37145 [Actinomycetes bacterium KLBMP 9759]